MPWIFNMSMNQTSERGGGGGGSLARKGRIFLFYAHTI